MNECCCLWSEEEVENDRRRIEKGVEIAVMEFGLCLKQSNALR